MGLDGGLPCAQGVVEGAQEAKRLVVRHAPVVLPEETLEHRARRRDAREEGRARAQFQVVGKTEDFRRGPALNSDRRRGALQQPRSEDRVVEIGPGLLNALDRVMLRRRTDRQPIDLRENVPHPMCALSSAPDFRESLVVVVRLRLQKSAQVVRVVGAARVD